MQAKKQVVIIGGGYAGMMTAIRLAGKDRKRKAFHITVVNAETEFVERPRLHEMATGVQIAGMPIRTLLPINVDFVVGWVSVLYPDRNAIEIKRQDETVCLTYDYLVYALGSHIDRHIVPGVEEYAYVLDPHGVRSTVDLQARLAEDTDLVRRIAIIGGGATGVEMAAQVKAYRPHDTVILISQDKVGTFNGDRIAMHIRQSLVDQGIEILDHRPVVALSASTVTFADGDVVAVDLCIWAGGFTANGPGADSGFAVNERRQLYTDNTLRSLSYPNVFVVGDAASPVVSTGAPLRMSLFTALVTGAHTADNLTAMARGRALRPLRFATYGQGIALGPNDAVGFATFPHDKARGPVFRRKTAVRIRNFFVWYLVMALKIERRWPGFFYWFPAAIPEDGVATTAARSDGTIIGNST